MKEIIRHSHNSYWITKPLPKGAENCKECDMAEYDIFYHRGEILVNHLAVPFKFLTYGVLPKPEQINKKWIYLELKTGNRKIIPLLQKLDYVNSNYVFGIAPNSLMGKLQGRAKLLNEILNTIPKSYYYITLKNYHTIIIYDQFEKHWYNKFFRKFW